MEKNPIDFAKMIYEKAKALPEDYQLIGAGIMIGLSAQVDKEDSEKEKKGA